MPSGLPPLRLWRGKDCKKGTPVNLGCFCFSGKCGGKSACVGAVLGKRGSGILTRLTGDARELLPAGAVQPVPCRAQATTAVIIPSSQSRRLITLPHRCKLQARQAVISTAALSADSVRQFNGPNRWNNHVHCSTTRALPIIGNQWSPVAISTRGYLIGLPNYIRSVIMCHHECRCCMGTVWPPARMSNEVTQSLDSSRLGAVDKTRCRCSVEESVCTKGAMRRANYQLISSAE